MSSNCFEIEYGDVDSTRGYCGYCGNVEIVTLITQICANEKEVSFFTHPVY